MKARYAVSQILVSHDWVVDLLDGPRKIAVRGEDGEILRFRTRESAEAAMARIQTAADLGR